MHNEKELFLYNDEGEYITYLQVKSKVNTSKPGVIFLSGFNSDITGSKATGLAQHCATHGYDYICFNYYGCGTSSGDFSKGTIGRWLDDVLLVIDKLTTGPQILVGSSMGGWLMLLAALKHPERIVGLVGIASAPDFTETLIWDMWNKEQQQILMETGQLELPADECEESMLITRDLIEDGRNHLLLGNTIPITCPVRLLHGMQDTDVPYQTSLDIAEKLDSNDVEVHYVKDGNHRMSSLKNLELIYKTVDELITQY